VIRRVLRDVPGQLIERPWVDFGHNRSEALVLARPHTDYTLVIDADEILDAPAGYRWPELTADCISLAHHFDGNAMVYWRPSLVANRLPWRYEGVLHEYLEAPDIRTRENLVGPQVVIYPDGARSLGLTSEEKYGRDVKILEAAVAAEPDNARYQYYLARSYRDAARPDEALPAFTRRAEMGGFAEEVWDSLHAIARLLEQRNADADTVIGAYLRAWESRPTRAEPLANLARYCRLAERFVLGRTFAGLALEIPVPDDLLWVEHDVYAWRSLDEFAVSSYWTGHYAESAQACSDLLAGDRLPADQRARVEANLEFAREKLPGAYAFVPRPGARAPAGRRRGRRKPVCT
jgi:tetratricopeptide (TPR) repeat protein